MKKEQANPEGFPYLILGREECACKEDREGEHRVMKDTAGPLSEGGHVQQCAVPGKGHWPENMGEPR